MHVEPARWRRDLNPCTRICSPLPRLSATPPEADRNLERTRPDSRADDGIRTRDPHLGKVMRYQLRYVRVRLTPPGATWETIPNPIPTCGIGAPSGASTSCNRQYEHVSQLQPTKTTAWSSSQPPSQRPQPSAWFRDIYATGLLEVSHDPAVLDGHGRWAVCQQFDGHLTLARFADWRTTHGHESNTPAGTDLGVPHETVPAQSWHPPQSEQWRSSMSAEDYRQGVRLIKEEIARGVVYQVNLCRVMSAPLNSMLSEGASPDDVAPAPDIMALADVLARGNPAPYAGALRLPATTTRRGIHIACASPELFLARHGHTLHSRPIKGTAKPGTDFLDKDYAENVMIVDLVRNDLSVVAEPGSVVVPEFLAVEQHPGLLHLVSGVSARLRTDASWADILAAAFPPGSVSGAPKSSALRVIERLEPVPRGPYCGAFGWVDADTGEGELAVAIRTFWIDDHPLPGQPRDNTRYWLKFGTGAGITWGSDPELEWQETELKAAKLVALASRETVDVADATPDERERAQHDRMG